MNLVKIAADLKANAEKVRKASRTALKIEGYRLRELLQKDLRRGEAGASAFSPLTEIAKRLGKPKDRKPLSRLAVAVRCEMEPRPSGAAMQIGFLVPNVQKRGNRMSKSWLRIAQAAQEGSETPFTEERRRALLSVGERMRKRKEPEAKYFFLRKTTTRFKTPARPIIEPFLQAHRAEIGPNVKDNFERKMRGERI
jgi:hypothetical protein